MADAQRPGCLHDDGWEVLPEKPGDFATNRRRVRCMDCGEVLAVHYDKLASLTRDGLLDTVLLAQPTTPSAER